MSNPVNDLSKLNSETDPARRLVILRECLSLAQQRRLYELEVEVLRWLANTYQDMNDLGRAHRYRAAALEVIQKYGAEVGLRVQSRVENDVGRTQLEAKEFRDAEMHFARALEMAERADDAAAACVMRYNLLLCNVGQKRWADVEPMAMKLVDEAEALNAHTTTAQTYLVLSQDAARSGRLNDGQRYAHKALAHAERCDDALLRARLIAQAQAVIGQIYHIAGPVTGRTEEYGKTADDWFERSNRSPHDLRLPSHKAENESQRGRFFEHASKLPQALSHYQLALEAWEAVRQGLGYEEFQASYFRDIQPNYEHIVELNLRVGDADGAFSAAEQLRSRLLLARIGDVRPSTATQDSAARRRSILTRYARAVMCPLETGHRGRGLRGVEADNHVDGSRSDEPSAADLIAARKEFLVQHERDRMSVDNWKPARPSSVVDWETAQTSLDSESALISYVVMEKTTAVFVATRDRRHFQHIPYGRERVRQDVTELDRWMRQLIQQATAPAALAHAAHRRSPSEPWPKEVEKAAHSVRQQLKRLYALLLAPVLPLIASKHHWSIMPYGVLHRIPWAALCSNGAYVAQTHSLSVLPSASVGVALAELPDSESSHQVFFGNPDAFHPIWLLPGAEDEIASCIARSAPTADAFVDEAATKSEFLAKGCDAAVIHFACHHFFDSEIPILSFIKLAGDGADALYAHEVMDLRLKARLVVLSACASGLSGTATGDEQLGMVRAFLAAGARSVLSTLWPIDDRSPVTFFSRFYELAKFEGVAKALATAQRESLAHPQFSLPCFWAPYQLTGLWNQTLY